MKNLLSKSLLCGVLATSFLLINCQKAPSRPLKADANNFQKPGDLVKSGPCNPAAIEKYDAAKAALTELGTLVVKPEPSEADIAEMSAKLAAANTLINDAKKAISEVRPEKDADACTKPNAEDAKKTDTLSAADFKADYVRLSALITRLGGSAPVVALKTGDKLELSEAVAALFTNPANGCISGGALKTTADCTALAARPEVTMCNFTGDGAEVKKEDKAEVLTVASKEEAGRKIVTINVIIKAPDAAEGEEAAGDRAMKIDCAIENTVRADDKAAEAATAALGSTVKVIVAAQQAPPEAGAQSEEPPAEPSPAAGSQSEPPTAPPAAVSDQLANSAQEGLNILGEGN